jgi:hypothetical protein
MHRAAFLLLAVALAAPASASAADRCRARSGEQVLARSGEAVVLQKIVNWSQHFPLQTVTGCSRRSGKRRVLDIIQRRTPDDQTKLIGVKLAGTRVAYAMMRGGALTLIVEDAVHGGRRHDLGIDGIEAWPFWTQDTFDLAWAVDTQGNVAWLETTRLLGRGAYPPQFLGVWRAGLGRRLVDSHAFLSGVTLRDGVLRWLRNGRRRQVDLTSMPASHCGALNAVTGTLDIDLVWDQRADAFTACLRKTGATVAGRRPFFAVADANGPYLLLAWAHACCSYVTVVDLVRGTIEDLGGSDAVVGELGSLAWKGDGGLWVRDAAGIRKIADYVDDPDANATHLQRDGSTITWPGVGVTVTLNP